MATANNKYSLHFLICPHMQKFLDYVISFPRVTETIHRVITKQLFGCSGPDCQVYVNLQNHRTLQEMYSISSGHQ